MERKIDILPTALSCEENVTLVTALVEGMTEKTTEDAVFCCRSSESRGEWEVFGKKVVFPDDLLYA